MELDYENISIENEEPFPIRKRDDTTINIEYTKQLFDYLERDRYAIVRFENDKPVNIGCSGGFSKEEAIEYLQNLSGKECYQVYFGLHTPIDYSKINEYGRTKGDNHSQFYYIYIDCDPIGKKELKDLNEKGIFITETLDRPIVFNKITKYLASLGLYACMVFDTGRGFSIHIACDLPNTIQNENNIKKILDYINDKIIYLSGHHIDTSVIDVARITRIPGSYNIKTNNIVAPLMGCYDENEESVSQEQLDSIIKTHFSEKIVETPISNDIDEKVKEKQDYTTVQISYDDRKIWAAAYELYPPGNHAKRREFLEDIGEEIIREDFVEGKSGYYIKSKNISSYSAGSPVKDTDVFVFDSGKSEASGKPSWGSARCWHDTDKDYFGNITERLRILPKVIDQIKEFDRVNQTIQSIISKKDELIINEEDYVSQADLTYSITDLDDYPPLYAHLSKNIVEKMLDVKGDVVQYQLLMSSLFVSTIAAFGQGVFDVYSNTVSCVGSGMFVISGKTASGKKTAKREAEKFYKKLLVGDRTYLIEEAACTMKNLIATGLRCYGAFEKNKTGPKGGKNLIRCTESEARETISKSNRSVFGVTDEASTAIMKTCNIQSHSGVNNKPEFLKAFESGDSVSSGAGTDIPLVWPHCNFVWMAYSQPSPYFSAITPFTPENITLGLPSRTTYFCNEEGSWAIDPITKADKDIIAEGLKKLQDVMKIILQDKKILVVFSDFPKENNINMEIDKSDSVQKRRNKTLWATSIKEISKRVRAFAFIFAILDGVEPRKITEKEKDVIDKYDTPEFYEKTEYIIDASSYVRKAIKILVSCSDNFYVDNARCQNEPLNSLEEWIIRLLEESNTPLSSWDLCLLLDPSTRKSNSYKQKINSMLDCGILEEYTIKTSGRDKKALRVRGGIK